MALTTAFARNGDKLEIPQTTTSDGSVSYEQGFGNLYALPPENGGKFIDRAQFNQLMYDTTSEVLANKAAIATKANTSEVVKLTTNQNIQGVKTFASPPVSATNPTANNQVANKAYVDTVGNTAVKLKGDQSIAGVKTFTSNIVSPNITAMQNNLNTIFSSTTTPVKTQNTTKTITVGTGGNFADLPSAIAEARKYTSIVIIKLISNLNITGDINISNLNGAHIKINFNDFKIINTSSDVRYSLTLHQSRFGQIIKLNLQGYQLAVVNNSSVSLTESVTINNKQYENADCIRCWFGSTVAIADNTTMTLSHSNERSSFHSSVGSIIGVGGSSTITDSSNNGFVLNAYRGGIIDVTAVTITINSTSAAKANQAANTPTANGIIFGEYSL